MMALKIGTAAALMLALCSGAAAAQDQFQWLEDPKDPKALSWAETQTAASRAAIAAMPGHEAIKAELQSVIASGDPAPQIQLLGPVALRLRRNAAHPHGVLAVARRDKDGIPQGWRDVLDIDALGRAEGKSFTLRFGQEASACLPPSFTRCILALAPGGGDEVELREFDLATGQFVADGFRAPASRSWFGYLDKDHLLIEHTVGGASPLPSGWPGAVYLWTRGTPLEAAREVYRAQPDHALMMVSAVGTGADRVGVIMDAADYTTISYHVVRPAGQVESTSLPEGVKIGLVKGAGPRIVVQLAKSAMVGGQSIPQDSVLAYETGRDVPADKRLSVVFKPAKDEVVSDPIDGIAAGRSKIRISLIRRGMSRIVTATKTADGWQLDRPAPGPVGSSASIQSADPLSDTMVAHITGYLTPTRLELVGGTKPATLFAETALLDAGKFVVDLKTARSKDGTEIDYFLLRPKTPAAALTPTLMTGYGAYGVTFAPAYLDYTVGGRSLVLWLNRGGALAMPLIRGGGDRGQAWHQAAIREKRQNSYDDFAAVAEQLISSKFTAPKMLGVFGWSNGGLLAAVMGTQRPDLFGAVVSDSPITDVMRMPYMGMGSAWVSEFGDGRKPEDRAIIARYSPYELVRSGVRYPPFLITAATSDNRVGPGHARKLAAKLQAAGSTAYLIENREGGHDVSDDLARPDLMADRMTFLIDTLMTDR